MDVKAIKDLAQLSDPDFFAAVSTGLQLVAKNLNRLYEGARVLGEMKQHGGRVLSKVAEEEAGKFLILMDAVRCPKQPSARLAVQLERFNSHLAKGIYAKACMYCPGRLGQLQEYIESDRKQYYLDGPNDVDWIFRNEVIDDREASFYVDYVRHDDGHRWSDPAVFDDIPLNTTEPAAVRMARGLHDAGMSTQGALETVAEVWRAASINMQTHHSSFVDLNRATLELLESRGQLQTQPSDVYGRIVHDWLFPMYGLDLSLIKVDLGTLREQQRNWGPDNY